MPLPRFSPDLAIRISLCMIVRDEEASLIRCLESIQGLVDEIVVVDTGSGDRTPQLARNHGANVIEMPWRDDFSAARNESLRHAQGAWIFWLDADEWLIPSEQHNFAALKARLHDPVVAYLMRQESRLPSPIEGSLVVDQVRLFPKISHARWTYRVHEQIAPALKAASIAFERTPITISHAGYVDSETQRRKRQRNLALLEIETREKPTDAFPFFNLGGTLLELERPFDAIEPLEKALTLVAPHLSYAKKIWTFLITCLLRLDRKNEAAEAAYRAIARFPRDYELLLLNAQILCKQELFREAKVMLDRLLQLPDQLATTGLAVEGIRSRARLLLNDIHPLLND